MTKPYLGVWVDHKQAFLLWMDEQGEADVQHTEADYPERGEKSDRVQAGAGTVYGGMAPHAHVEQKRQQQSKKFYDTLFRAIRKAPEVYIFGPGQAKKELQKRLKEHKDFNGRIRAVESAKKMSEAQMAAKVRGFFGLPRTAA